MNSTNKMKVITMLMGMIIIALTILIVTFAIFYKNKSKGYKELEVKIVEIAKNYVEDNNLYPVKNTKLKIEISELQDKGLIGELIVENDKCTGFVVVTNEENQNYNYNSYISCKLYITRGFQKAK